MAGSRASRSSAPRRDLGCPPNSCRSTQRRRAQARRLQPIPNTLQCFQMPSIALKYFQKRVDAFKCVQRLASALDAFECLQSDFKYPPPPRIPRRCCCASTRCYAPLTKFGVRGYRPAGCCGRGSVGGTRGSCARRWRPLPHPHARLLPTRTLHFSRYTCYAHYPPTLHSSFSRKATLRFYIAALTFACHTL
eukprot:2988143-Pleurochrysis_carterae.AAC.2